MPALFQRRGLARRSAAAGRPGSSRPRRTLKSCGSSSIEKRRRKWPTRVIRGSSRILNITPSSDSFIASSSALRCSASTYIERNLIRLKLLLPRPARGWRKKTGPRDSTLIAIAVASITGEKSASRAAEPTMSSIRLAATIAEGEDGDADREQRQAADLVERADAVEELEEARDDVDGDAGVAAGADRLQQLLVADPGEGDDHPVDALHLDDLARGRRSRRSGAGRGCRCRGRRCRRGRPGRARTGRWT